MSAADKFAEYPNVMNPECPWVGLREAGGLPNVKWCEETLCSVIAEPANTWSNVAFLIAAGYLWWLTKNDKERMLRFWAPATFWVGITSLVYHATVAFVTQVFDFWGMYFFFAQTLLLNLLRMGTIKVERFFKILWVSIFALTGITVVVAKLNLPVQGIVALLLVGILVTEGIAAKRSTEQRTWKYLAGALGFIFVAGIFSASDASRAWCDRHDHVFQGHAIWHVLNGFGITLAHFHYRQFRGLYV
jgi:hypothetical protein